MKRTQIHRDLQENSCIQMAISPQIVVIYNVYSQDIGYIMMAAINVSRVLMISNNQISNVVN